MWCKPCSIGDPKSWEHYHIIVKNGVVTDVTYVSDDGTWDRELAKDEWFVEYTDDCIIARLANTIEAVTIPTLWKSGTPANEEWIKPKVYRGASKEDKEQSAMEKVASGVRTVHDLFRFTVDHVKRLFR